MKLDFGYFMMFAGRGQFDEDSGGSVWSLSGATGAELVFSMEYTKPFTFPAPPIPMYFNIAFTASVGLGAEGLYFSFFVDDDMNLRNFEWSLVHGLTINVRLTLTVTFGVGIKGLCSAWIAASGGLNVIVQILVAQPAHIAVYGEFFLSVGFELLWIKYSRELWRSPYWMIYSNYEIKSEADSGLFAAYADAPDTDAVEETLLEPGRYPALAPQAKKVLSDVSDAHAGIRVATSQGRAFAFYLADAYSEIDRKSYRRVCWVNVETGEKGSAQAILEAPYRSSRGQYQEGRDAFNSDDYGFDVRSDGEYIYLMACCSRYWDDVNQYGVPKTSEHYIMRLEADGGALKGTELYTARYGNDQTVALPYIMEGNGAYYSANPQICTVSGRGGNFVMAGAVDFSDVSGARGGWYVQEVKLLDGRIASASSRFEVNGPNHRTRTGVFPFVRRVMDGDYDAGLSWACLEEGQSGQDDTALELVIRELTSTDAGILAAEKGIGSFRLLSTPDRDGSRYAQTIFYTQTETVGERAQSRIRSILLQPMADVDAGDRDGIGMVYTDYDLSIPDADFRVVTLGASQYLYWLSTVTKEKESDPDIWRINGVYCDAATGIMSDEIVIAEFTLPDAEWNGRRTRCVITDAAGTTVVSDEAVLTVIGTDKQPETGDHTRLPLYLAVALIAAALLLILRRRERDRT